MQPKKAKSSFLKHLKKQGLNLDKLIVTQGIEAMLSFYRHERADGCSFSDDEDMLLYQWGTYDWGDGEFFEFNITRQIIFGGSEDENIWQLSLTFKFNPIDALLKLDSGNRWCGKVDEIDRFEKYILNSKALQFIQSESPIKIELEFECAG